MIRVGITGQPGFVGTHLYNTFGLFPDKYERVAFEDSIFGSEDRLRNFVKSCDVIVHLAAVNRNPDPDYIYKTNVHLVQQLIDAMEAEKITPHILFSSSTQEELENPYGNSKLEGRRMLEEWATRNKASFTGMVLPNVFGPYGRPNYNSFVATFCYRLTHNERPEVLNNSMVRLIYVGNVCKHILSKIDEVNASKQPMVERDKVPYDFEGTVSDMLHLFEGFTETYFSKGFIPELKDSNEINLFNTYRSYIDLKSFFPKPLDLHQDDRGVFVETLKSKLGGQVSFSTTKPGITRGNHYHTRKIERFTVIRGKARIQLRKIGTDEVLDFFLDGSSPSYVDMPIWYTHNITNIGDGELYTQFWINEWYNPDDPDTFYETV